MRVLAVILLVLLLNADWSGEERLPLTHTPMRLTVRPVALDERHPGRTQLGALTYLGGWSLEGRDEAFGGFSSMSVVGDRFTLLSDGGEFLRFRMPVPGTLIDPRIGELPVGPGTGWRKQERDSESMTLGPDGSAWVGFERFNMIWHYAPGLRAPARQVAPRAMQGWPDNGGPEAMVRLRSGAFLVFGETAQWKGAKPRVRAAIRFEGDPVVSQQGFRFGYLPPRGFSPVDVAELPDGRLLMLNRRFAFPYEFTAKLVLIDPVAIRPGATVQGREIAAFEGDVIHDNLEGLAISREGKDVIVWLCSDSNQSMLQRNLLLRFKLEL